MSNARIQFSLATEEDWLSYDPQLKEGEIVTVIKGNKKVKLVQGKIGGSKYSESTVIWDEAAAQSLMSTSEAAAQAAGNHAVAAAASQSAAAASQSAAKASETASKTSENKAKSSETAAANSAAESAAAAADASTQAGMAQDSATAASTSAQEAAAHKNIAVSKATAADQSATAALEYKNQAVESAGAASTAANTASTKAATATSEAAKSKNEADRAQGYANSVNPANFVLKSNFVPFQGATQGANGAAGLVPAPNKAQVGMFLSASGGWGAAVTPTQLTQSEQKFEWDFWHRHGHEYVPDDTSNMGWNSKGIFISSYGSLVLPQQPSQWGQLINIPASRYEESTQIWINQINGEISTRKGNHEEPIHNRPFRKLLMSKELFDSGNSYARFNNGLQICWGQTNFLTAKANSVSVVPITFAAPFFDTHYRPVLSLYTNSGSHADMTKICITSYNYTTTSFDARVYAGALSSNQTPVIKWIAIGRWE
ncbi:MAG: hypothetical protein SPI35_08140 [Porphyromonas sp.]|nr:hypothetical protein [Porphyromonas sp.]